MASIIFLLCLGGMVLFFLGTIIAGCVEMITSRRLRAHGITAEGSIQDIDLRPRPAGVYGKVRFTYRVNDATYTRKQTVGKDTAMSLLAGRSALPLFAEPKKVTVLVLPKRPSVARLASEPSNYMRIYNCAVLLVILVLLAVLFLFLLLATLKTPSNY